MHPLVTSRPTFYNGSPRVLKLSVLTAIKRSSSTAFSSIFHLTPRLVSPSSLQRWFLLQPPTTDLCRQCPVAPFFLAFASFAAWLLRSQSRFSSRPTVTCFSSRCPLLTPFFPFSRLISRPLPPAPPPFLSVLPFFQSDMIGEQRTKFRAFVLPRRTTCWELFAVVVK